MAVVAFAASASFAFLRDPEKQPSENFRFDLGRSTQISQSLSLPQTATQGEAEVVPAIIHADDMPQ